MRYLNSITGNSAINTVFVDFFDTIVHRTVHPNQVLRIWSKLLIRELGLKLKVDQLYFIRKDSSEFLAKKQEKKYWEIDYNELITEVYNRLTSTLELKNTTLSRFKAYFELADIRSETNVQYLNTETINLLKELKSKNYQIYCVTDFYTSYKVIEEILKFHGIDNLIEAVFSSADIQKSKYSGTLYPHLLQELEVNPSNVMMIGDNYSSDIKNAKNHGFETLYISNKKELKTAFKNLIGSDRKDYRKVLKCLYNHCNNKEAAANSDYILFYMVYVERLYHQLKKERINDIFFLSREGLFLKKMFDYYQEHFSLRREDNIRSHYLKTSRQASMLVSLKEIENEEYTFLKRKYPDLSLNHFLSNFTFNEEIISSIINELQLEDLEHKVIDNFLDSEVYEQLKTSKIFLNAYDRKRLTQQKAFATYLASFNVDFYNEGMHIADIGWGGSMQESLFDYFEGKVEVHGHYLGLTEIYAIQKNKARWGLNFSIFPYTTYFDNILRGNTELNEQLLSAGHGSTLSYNQLESYTNEYHHDVEKKVYDEHISPIQEFMFECYKDLLVAFDSVCYDDILVQKQMTDYALRIGLFASKRKVASAMKISKGFYTNVGNFTSGMQMSPGKYTNDKLKLLKTFILSPDMLFPALLRIKPYLYSKKKYFLAYLMPNWAIYYYIKFNRAIKRSIFQKISRFKYEHLK